MLYLNFLPHRTEGAKTWHHRVSTLDRLVSDFVLTLLRCSFSTGLMLWRAATRCALRRSKLRSVIGECLDSKYLQRRPLLATRSAKEQTDHWDTSWLEEDPWSSSNDIPPKTEDVSTQDAPTWSVSRGVSIDKRGQLKVTSSTDADKEYPAVLVVSAASRNLSRADFTRLLAEKDRLEQGGIKGPFISFQTQRV